MSTNLYIRNIPMEWTSADLIKLCEKYGSIVSAKVMMNPLTSSSRGMGFVRMSDHADAVLAIAGLNGHLPDNTTGNIQPKPLSVQFAKDQNIGASSSIRDPSNRYSPYIRPKTKENENYAHSNTYQTSESYAGADLAGGGNNSSNTDSAVNGIGEDLPVAPPNTDPLNVYVVDVPLNFTKEQFQAIYEPFGCLVSSTILTDPLSGVSRGIGFARYSNPDNAARAVKETQNLIVEGATKPFVVRFARDTTKKYEENTLAVVNSLHQQRYASIQASQQAQAAAAMYQPYQNYQPYPYQQPPTVSPTNQTYPSYYPPNTSIPPSINNNTNSYPSYPQTNNLPSYSNQSTNNPNITGVTPNTTSLTNGTTTNVPSTSNSDYAQWYAQYAAYQEYYQRYPHLTPPQPLTSYPPPQQQPPQQPPQQPTQQQQQQQQPIIQSALHTPTINTSNNTTSPSNQNNQQQPPASNTAARQPNSFR